MILRTFRCIGLFSHFVTIEHSYQNFLDWDRNYDRPLSTKPATTGNSLACQCWLPEMLILTRWRCSSGCYTLLLCKNCETKLYKSFQKLREINATESRYTFNNFPQCPSKPNLLREKKIHQITLDIDESHLISHKPLLSRNFCQKCVRENSPNFHSIEYEPCLHEREIFRQINAQLHNLISRKNHPCVVLLTVRKLPKFSLALNLAKVSRK